MNDEHTDVNPQSPNFWVNNFNFIKLADFIINSNGDLNFEPCIDNTVWKKKQDFVYGIFINGVLVKLGGSGTGCRDRANSFLTGAPKYNEKDNAVTNREMYKLAFNTIQSAGTVEWYGSWVKGPPTVDITLGNIMLQSTVEVYHAAERCIIEVYTNMVGEKPCMNKRAPRVEFTVKHIPDDFGFDLETLITTNKTKSYKTVLSSAQTILQNHQFVNRQSGIKQLIQGGIKSSRASHYYDKVKKEHDMLDMLDM